MIKAASSDMRVTGYGRTDVGKKREHNEDYLLQVAELGLYMVCDGMGGHAGGEVASETAARTVREHLEKNRRIIDSYDETDPARDSLLRLVDEAVQLASNAVFAVATSEQGKAGMGTTLTMVLVVKNIGVMGHVGDTRLYMQRAGRLHQLSEDHTYVNEMVRRGMATAEVAKKGPYANVITRAVGIQETVRVDTLLFDILAGDTLLLCSDGLSKHLESGEELARLLSDAPPSDVPQQLVDIANARGGSDNITALVLHAAAEGVEDLDVDRSRTTEVNLKLDTLRDIKLFSSLELGELCKVLNIVRVQEVDKGEVVLREGDPGDSFYAVLDGKFVVTRSGQAVTWLSTGAHFGEMTLFNNRPRSATIEAMQRSRVLVMERARFVELLQKEPSLGIKLLWAFAQVLSLRLDEASVQLYGALPADTRDTDLTTPFKPRD